jgi:hypothetical protein
MVDSTDRLKQFYINIPTNQGIHKENIDITSDNLEELITSIADKLNIQYDYVRDLVVKKMIGTNTDEYSERKSLSNTHSSMNISDKSEGYSKSILSMEKKNYGNNC